MGHKNNTNDLAVGNKCFLTFKPCCHKFEHDVFNDEILIHFQRTVFNKNNEIIYGPHPSMKTKDGEPLYRCPHCNAQIVFTKDLSETITWYGKGLKPIKK